MAFAFLVDSPSPKAVYGRTSVASAGLAPDPPRVPLPNPSRKESRAGVPRSRHELRLRPLHQLRAHRRPQPLRRGEGLDRPAPRALVGAALAGARLRAEHLARRPQPPG